MRWILLIAILVGFGIAFTTRSPALMGLGLVLGIGGLLYVAFAFAASRVALSAQPETNLIVDPEIRAMRAKASAAKAAAATHLQGSAISDDSARANNTPAGKDLS